MAQKLEILPNMSIYVTFPKNARIDSRYRGKTLEVNFDIDNIPYINGEELKGSTATFAKREQFSVKGTPSC